MKCSCKYMMISAIILFLAAAVGFSPGKANAAFPTSSDGICASDNATPPFLSGGVDPNLLLVFDNSASMLDLAYVKSTSTCFDDTFDNAISYAGYFERPQWYAYNFTSGKFEQKSDSDANTFCSDSGTEYTSAYLCVDGTITTTSGVDELTAVTSFYATGNLLNWAAASKLDIQKEILTGGKYDDINDRLKLESRGCGDKRFVKKIPVSYGAVTHYVTLGIRPPRATVYKSWVNDKPYVTGDIVSNAGGDLYKATSSGTSNGTVVTDDIGVSWTPYWQTRWHNGIAYPAGALVTDPSKKNSVDEGRVYIATNSGTASGTGVADDANITWEPYDLTYIEIFTGSADGFNNTACQAAIDELNSANPSQGQLKGYIDSCMNYSLSSGSGGAGSADANNAFNQGVHNCWYLVKQGEWQPGQGPETSMANSCEAIYASGINPWDITPENRAYVCYGQNPNGRTDEITTDDSGYVGRCWWPASGGAADIGITCQWQCKNTSKTYPTECSNPNQQEHVCSVNAWQNGVAYALNEVVSNAGSATWYKSTSAGTSNGASVLTDTGVSWTVYVPTAGDAAKWSDTDEGYGVWNDALADNVFSDPSTAGAGNSGDCIRYAMKQFCAGMEVPEVIDPSDQVGAATGDTDVTWGLPAILTDSGVVAQLNEPIAVMKGFIAKATAPEGLIQEFANDIRMGAMTFNDEGSKSECAQADPFVLYECTKVNNKDGGKVIQEIGKSAAHTTSLVSQINNIKALSWTPIAEALFNALGYYGQNSAMRLDANDFAISSADDPVTAYCQDNNILVITEGASTADVNSTVVSFVATTGQNDADTEVADCGSLKGSTLLDDLTWFAKNSLGCYQTPTMNDSDGNPQNKKSIATHIVVAGTLRNTGTGECNPTELLTQAAANGGTALYEASDPSQLENTLRAAFAAIRAGAAAGSAASVISASRSGEGAAYQAIFWPSVDLASGDTVQWIGEVHSLLVDSFGQLYEDSNGDHAFDSGDQRIVFFFDQSINQTKACLGDVDAGGACTGATLDLEDVKYHWSAARWLSEIAPTAATATATGDILQNRTLVGATAGYISNTKKRFVFTWNDLNNDGIVDSDELLDFTPGTTWSTLVTAPVSPRGPVPLDFGVRTDAEVDKIIRWMRGMDYTPDDLRLRQMPYDFDHSGTPETVTWRLGDVIHSTPVSVAAPAEGFHFLYRDNSYALFVAAYKKRRHMIYFGGNDGMMHAVNGGFYDEAQKAFCRTSTCGADTDTPELGAEMWAYVPYNLLPQLKCMTSTGYQHKYYVDQRPRIFDVRLWDASDTIHVGGWGTIMVGAMRFGGGKVQPKLLDLDGTPGADYGADTREFTSAYFIMDITNPEEPPKLLAEMTRTATGSEAELGYTLAIPTLVVMKNAGPPVTYKWYLIMGSGPTSVTATSDQKASLGVMPLDWLGQNTIVSPARAFRIPATGFSNEGGQLTLDYTSNSFVLDPVTVDFDLDENYKADVVYFGTVSGTSAPYGGGMQRLVTRKINSVTGKQEETLPSEWGNLLNTAPFTDTHSALVDNPLPLINTNQPVTASASVGTDGKNYWVYFGTGRFLDTSDKSDANQQTYYGIKEPLSFSGPATNCQPSFTWQTVEKTATNGWNTTPGEQGLLDVTNIQVHQATTANAATLSCSAGSCLSIESPAGTTNTLTTFDTLLDYIAGTGTGCNHPATDSNGTDGWYKDFLLGKERNLGQATLLGGLVTYTTYQPYSDACLPEGLGYLYGVYFQTGTPFYIPIFISTSSTGMDAGGNIIDKVALGRGLATTPNLHVGKQEGAKAFVQTSTGTIVEIPQPNLPIQNAKTGKATWGEIK